MKKRGVPAKAQRGAAKPSASGRTARRSAAAGAGRPFEAALARIFDPANQFADNDRAVNAFSETVHLAALAPARRRALEAWLEAPGTSAKQASQPGRAGLVDLARGILHRHAAEVKPAETALRAALKSFAAAPLGDLLRTPLETAAWNWLASLHTSACRFEEARQACLRSAERIRSADRYPTNAEGWLALVLGKLALAERKAEAGLRELSRAGKLFRDTGNTLGQSEVHFNLARTHLWSGQCDQARQEVEHGMRLREGREDLEGRIKAYWLRGRIHRCAGDPAMALECLEVAARLADAGRRERLRAAVAHCAGDIRAASGEWDLAEKQYQNALRICRRTGDGPGERRNRYALVKLAFLKARSRDDAAEMDEILVQCAELRTRGPAAPGDGEAHLRKLEAKIELLYARILQALGSDGNVPTARKHFLKAVESFDALGFRGDGAEACAAYAEALEASGDHGQAATFLWRAWDQSDRKPQRGRVLEAMRRCFSYVPIEEIVHRMARTAEDRTEASRCHDEITGAFANSIRLYGDLIDGLLLAFGHLREGEDARAGTLLDRSRLLAAEARGLFDGIRGDDEETPKNFAPLALAGQLRCPGARDTVTLRPAEGAEEMPVFANPAFLRAALRCLALVLAEAGPARAISIDTSRLADNIPSTVDLILSAPGRRLDEAKLANLLERKGRPEALGLETVDWLRLLFARAFAAAMRGTIRFESKPAGDAAAAENRFILSLPEAGPPLHNGTSRSRPASGTGPPPDRRAP